MNTSFSLCILIVLLSVVDKSLAQNVTKTGPGGVTTVTKKLPLTRLSASDGITITTRLSTPDGTTIEKRVAGIERTLVALISDYQSKINNLNQALAAQRYEIASGTWKIKKVVNGYPIINRVGFFNKVFKSAPKIFYTIRSIHVVNNVAALYSMTNEQISTLQFSCDIQFYGVFDALELIIEWIAYGRV